ncbi:MAG: glutamate synthase large subunit [Dehalococcoidia bacterium]
MSYLPKAAHTLYDPRFETDACGVGFLARPGGEPSHDIVEMALTAVVNLAHRGAVDADAKTGDGAGILVQVPRRFLAREAKRLGFTLDDPEKLAVAMAFLPAGDEAAARPDGRPSGRCRELIEEKVRGRGLNVLGWREVPIDRSVLGEKALATCPSVWQLLVTPPDGLDGDAYERVLFLARKEIEAAAREEGIEHCYIPSFSHRTLVYKGLLVAKQVREFYPDLQDPEFESALALFHQRYSTNTFPSWHLAQPLRYLAHNGEINTVWGNENWMRAREPELHSQVWGEDIGKLRPIITPGNSDSASLDNSLEALYLSGRDLLHAMLMLVPQAWERMPDLDPAWRDFYEYHACLMEPWDGPAGLSFTDGNLVGAVLDRNGLRPLRYKIAKDGLVVAASEVGVVDMPDADVVEKGRLGPGEMIVVDVAGARMLKKPDIMAEVVNRQPYGQWVGENLIRLPPTPPGQDGDSHRAGLNGIGLPQLQMAFACTNEDVKMIIKTMVTEGHDPVWSMGDDVPLAVLSEMRRPLMFYFKQRFAQVSNPAIDPLREELVMSLDCYLGPRHSVFEETPHHARLIHLPYPILTAQQIRTLRENPDPSFKPADISCLFPARDGPEALAKALDRLCEEASAAVDAGAAILILSDAGVNAESAPIPMLLAAASLHHHLIREGKRMRTDIVVETGAAWDIHHFALLLGFGVNGIHPYLVNATVRSFLQDRDMQESTLEEAEGKLRTAMERGILKIMSKMGISALSSYRGAQIFEAIGLSEELVERCFTGTPARLGGIGLREIGEDVLHWHSLAFPDGQPKRLPDIGYIRFRKEGEYHGFNPTVVTAFQAAVRENDAHKYDLYSNLVHGGPPRTLRDIMEFQSDQPSIPIEEVEPIESLFARFVTAGMSMGALSPRAHATIAAGMNRIGARSNTGEGGEDPDWYEPFPNGDSANSRIKQVASGRFGVTAAYLSQADELEIKIAQGSKPGEGGQLPGHKVTEFIARMRHAVTGIPLISPPPHHDIYSIEDIAQLIYDLKQANPRARVGVKLVAESGVGTIAAGVVKAYADYIQISGMDGGTGASPLSSIKNAGCPWELGLAETQQVLMLNGLRGRIRLRTDGGIKTGRDVIVAAMLGADEFGFGTATLVAIGCDMARQCHLNTCPTGIATQRQDLIDEKFSGDPQHVVNYFTFVANEVRQYLAYLGYRSLGDLIGRVDLLSPKGLPKGHRGRSLILEAILADVDPAGLMDRHCTQFRNDRPHPCADDRLLPEVEPAIESRTPVRVSTDIRNSDLTAGGRIAGMIAHRYRKDPLPEGTIEINYRGSAGQSFGAWCTTGMRLTLEGEANDYVGKGMCGGEIVVRPPEGAPFAAHENVIIGNTVLYGATGGRMFVAGRAGERFAVRNSGAVAVIEGAGDHCCEYMTQGVVVVLGATGRNFGAGMSHGFAYVLDEDGSFPRKYNPELVTIDKVSSKDDLRELKGLIEEHVEKTGSARGREILDGWSHYLPLFWKVSPQSLAYKIDGHVDEDAEKDDAAKAAQPQPASR